MRTTVQRLAVPILMGLAGCADNAIMSPALSPEATLGTTSVTTPSSGPWARVVEGEVGPGALYAFYIPRAWNGDAVYYSHGARDVDSPIDLRNSDNFFAVRDMLGAHGFAVAYSSWSDNGVAIKDGAQRVHQLRGILAAELRGSPTRSFLMSHSLGSGVALDLVQRYPNHYDGALLMCGMVGGTLLQSQYAGDVRALMDAFYPGRFAGNVLQIPAGTPYITLPDVIAAVQSNPQPLYVIASLTQTPLPYIPSGSVFDPQSLAFQSLVGSLYGPLSYQSRFANNLFELAHGHPTYDNSATTYSLGQGALLPPGVLQPAVDYANAAVKRYAMDPAGRNFMERYFTPTGDLRIPVLTLHNTWDPGVPAFHEAAFLATVQAAGATQNLLQRLYPDYGHCNLPPAVQAQNFLDLVNWVSTGVKPAS